MRMLVLVALFASTACSGPERKAPYTTTAVPENEAGGFECSADVAQYAVGRASSVELATELMKKTGSKTLRWIPPRTAITKDFRVDRLNIGYDDNMIITMVNCG